MSNTTRTVNVISELTTRSHKALNFYNKHPNIDFVDMNDMMVDLLNNIISNINGDITSSLTKDLIDSIKVIGKEIVLIKDSVDKSNNEVLNNILLKLYEQKSDFINEVRMLIDNKDNESLLKIFDKMEKEQMKLINDIIPKSNTEYYQKYENAFRDFKEELKTTNKLEVLEKKHNEMIKNIESSLISYLCQSEERLHNNMNEIKSINILNSEVQKELNTNLTSHLNRYTNSTYKGQLAENRIDELLCSIYKSSEIVKTTKESKSGDLLLNRTNMSPILFEVKDYNVNVPIHEIDKFIRDVNENNISGVMLSISSGIANKNNFQIDITKNNNICIYIHNMNYDIEKIRLAVDIIDNLSNKLKINKNNITISTETIEQINNEYQTFILKRDMAINQIKESTKKTIQYIEEMELKSLNNYLSSKFSFKNSSTLKCELCNSFIGTNLKSLAVHKRKCKGMKNDTINDESVKQSSEENNSEELKKTSSEDSSEIILNKKPKKKNKVIIV
jgi:hypothetical protein